jgi:peptidyl-prolyl cis-trans isomerase SurA
MKTMIDIRTNSGTLAKTGASARLRAVVCALALAGAAAAFIPAPAAAQQIVAFVYGEPITALDVDQRARIIEVFSRKKASRKEVLDELIDQKLKLHQARRLDIDIDTAQINREYAAMARRGGRSVPELDQAFQQAGISVTTFKTKLRADLAWRDVMQKMSPGSFQIRDADVVAALVARGQTTSSKAFQYTMRQVVFVVPRGSPDSARAARLKEAEALRAKFQSCETDLALAREYREVVVREPVIRISTDLPQRLRELIEKTPDGRMTPPEPTAAGIEVVAICGRKETVADLNSRTEIREELLSQRIDSQEKKILDDLRRKAVIDYR